MEYLYRKGGTDYALAATRLEEVAQVMPAQLGAAVELGNLYLKLGKGDAARTAYARPLAQEKIPVEPLVRKQLLAQLALLDGGAAVGTIKPMRNPWAE
jgi:Flp pilus assembly protein TadD